MTSNKEERVSRVREAKNNLILDAALKVFSETGFHESRLEDIAKEAGFSKASLYNYYKDKETIFFQLAIREHEVLAEKIKFDPLFHIDESLHFLENMRRLFTIIFNTFGTHFSFLLTLDTSHFITIFEKVKKIKGSVENAECQFLELKERMDTTLFRLIEESKKSGDIKSQLSSERLAIMIDSMIMGTLKHWHIDGKMGDVPATVDELVLFLSEGFSVTK
jgi:AcrR family transcriptional regulator